MTAAVEETSFVNHTRNRSNSVYDHSWEPAVAERIDFELTKHDAHSPYIVCLVGLPGGGKSISSLLLANFLDERGIGSMIMPHDGYHYTIEQLKLFPDPEDVIYRRGAPDTFDPNSLLRDLDRIRNGKEEELILVPGFDHGKGDPEPDAHAFDRSRHQVVICEGLYLLHDQDGWEDVKSMFDLKIFIQSDIDNCIDRLKIRNLVIPGYTPEQIQLRCEEVDRVNAMTVMKTKERADLVVESIVAKQQPREIAKAMKRHKRTPSTEALNLMISKEQEMDVNPPSIQTEIEPATIPTHDFPTNANLGRWEKDMADRIYNMLEDPTATASGKPFMLGLVGMPGSGKSVSSLLLATELEHKVGMEVFIMPHDGYHYMLDHLMTFSNAEDFVHRRGAPDTFDPQALLRDLDRIRGGDEDMIFIPGFDHANGDPEPDKHVFDRSKHKVVICEGLYLLHDGDGWEEIRDRLDFSIYMDTDLELCIERVKVRNQCIPGYTVEEILERAETVDRTNAMTVQASRSRADVVVNSNTAKPSQQ